MKLSTRFTLLAFATAGIASVVLAATLLMWQFQSAQRVWSAEARIALTTNTAWPLMLHTRDQASISTELDLLSGKIVPVASISAVHVQGDLLGRVISDGYTELPDTARNATNRLDVLTELIQVARSTANDAKWRSYLPWSNSVLRVSIPILSPVNPLESELSPLAFRQLEVEQQGNGARFIVGYIETAVHAQQLWATLSESATRILLAITAALISTLLVLRMLSHSISQPLERMAAIAHAINDDALPKKVRLPIHRKDEIGDIAKVLNNVIDGVHRIKAKHNVDQTLLSLRMDAASRKLSKAEQEVTRTQSQIQKVAYFDSVTGLPNRRLMLEQLGMLMSIAARERKHLGVLLIDLENLRRINESLGRDAGDKVLRVISNRIADTVRSSDVVSRDEQPRDIARVGNDEFCILLHGIDQPKDAQRAADRLMTELSKPIEFGKQSLQVKCFMGLAIAPDHGRKPDELLRAADVAVNDARARGHYQPNLYQQAMAEQGSERFQLEVDLRNAEFEQEFELHYQPQINAETGELTGVEALVRWQHPERGNVPPFKFITIAEETGVIVDLGNWILDRACRDLIAMRAQGIDIPKLSVNVSALQLTEHFIEYVASTLSRHNLEPTAVQLELTESLLVNDLDIVLERLTRLRYEVGVRLSVDDFGTGYSSLAYLSRFPLNELKVDRSFVLAMEQDESAAKVTGAIIAIAKQLELDVVVEGVENPETYTQLRSFGAYVIQGYLFSKPLPQAELQQFIKAKGWEQGLALLPR